MNSNGKTELTMMTILFLVSSIVIGICLARLDSRVSSLEKALDIHLQRGQ